jgi:hypothetical protein
LRRDSPHGSSAPALVSSPRSPAASRGMKRRFERQSLRHGPTDRPKVRSRGWSSSDVRCMAAENSICFNPDQSARQELHQSYVGANVASLFPLCFSSPHRKSLGMLPVQRLGGSTTSSRNAVSRKPRTTVGTHLAPLICVRAGRLGCLQKCLRIDLHPSRRSPSVKSAALENDPGPRPRLPKNSLSVPPHRSATSRDGASGIHLHP